MSGAVVPDPSAKLPGRGAWVHPTSACVDKAVARKAFGRALRVAGQLETDPVQTWITQQTSVTQKPGVPETHGVIEKHEEMAD